jgi:hypothetical protein
MPVPVLPRYPVYIPSKGRFDNCITARYLLRDGVPFSLVVEPHERHEYAARFGDDRVLALPFRDRGTSVPARNWIWDHARAAGAARHWCLDDNMRGFYRRFRGQRLSCQGGVALRVVEDFADRYENLAICGMNYDMFAPEGVPMPPFYLNVHVYSCILIETSLGCRWRGRYNEDTDLCLQALATGRCTALMNAFLVKKVWTMAMKGGNTDSLYKGDGRLKMARSLERAWPGVVETKRRFKRPQHVIKDQWKGFDTPLIPRPRDQWPVPPVPGYGLQLRQVRPTRSASLRELVGDAIAGPSNAPPLPLPPPPKARTKRAAARPTTTEAPDGTDGGRPADPPQPRPVRRVRRAPR